MAAGFRHRRLRRTQPDVAPWPGGARLRSPGRHYEEGIRSYSRPGTRPEPLTEGAPTVAATSMAVACSKSSGSAAPRLTSGTVRRLRVVEQAKNVAGTRWRHGWHEIVLQPLASRAATGRSPIGQRLLVGGPRREGAFGPLLVVDDQEIASLAPPGQGNVRLCARSRTMSREPPHPDLPSSCVRVR